MKFWWTASKEDAELQRKLNKVKNKLLLITGEIKELIEELPEDSSMRIYVRSAVSNLECAIAAATRK